MAISVIVPALTSGARAGRTRRVLNATSAAQLQNIGVNAILANMPAITDGAASTIIVTAFVKARASRALG
jgi:hypothetical protein